MYNKNLIYSYILDFVKSNDLRHEVHEFLSGAIMIDIWKDNKFFVLQIEKERVGFSLVDDNDPEFSTVPDQSYSDFENFKINFEKELC